MTAFLCGLLLVFGQASFVQADPLSRIADDVVEQTVFDLPATKNDSQPTRYNLWMYQNFMLSGGNGCAG